MKIKSHRIVFGTPFGLTTVGHWEWKGGTLHIYVCNLPWRMYVAVWGHEFLEALWCKMRGITTEVCDEFDYECERQIQLGTRRTDIEQGDDPKCPYYWGHQIGQVWETLWCLLSFQSTKRYGEECNRVMGLSQ